MTTYTPEEQQFLDFWIPRIQFHMEETGILPLDLLANLTAHPDEVELLERYFDLYPTWDVNQFLDNYRKTYYTKQCIDYQPPNQCLSGAARRGDREIVELLLPRATVDGINNAIASAARGGHQGIMKMLLTSHATIDNINRAFVEAAGGGHREIVEMLANPPYNATTFDAALKNAVTSGQLSMAEMLLPLATDDGIEKVISYVGILEDVTDLPEYGEMYRLLSNYKTQLYFERISQRRIQLPRY